MNPLLIRIAYRASFLVALMVGLLALSSGALLTTALARAGVALFVSSMLAWGMILLVAPRGEPEPQTEPKEVDAQAGAPTPQAVTKTAADQQEATASAG